MGPIESQTVSLLNVRIQYSETMIEQENYENKKYL